MSKKEKTSAQPTLLAISEISLIFLLFFAYAGWPPPDINESHYLTKARHYWNPEWCENDLFLQSDDAHLVFFIAFGWITKYLSLISTAWVGRFASWLLLAFAWRQLSMAIAPGKLMSVLTAAWFLMVLEHCHMSGEWIVGGVEGKSFAYAFVWLGIAAIVRQQWRWSWIWLGLAAAFHVIVGGWATLAALITCLTRQEARSQIRQMIPTLVIGALLATPSVIVGLGLDRGSDADVISDAARIMVFSRLKHHLVIHEFPMWFIVRFCVAAGIWLLISGYAARDNPQEQRLNRFISITFAIAVVGTMVDLGLRSYPSSAAQILKYYWYRLADASLPVGISLTLASAVVRRRKRSTVEADWLLVILMVVPTFVLSTTLHGRRYDFRPRAERQMVSNESSPEQRKKLLQNWHRVCYWIRENTATDALFCTPRAQQTFKWYAERAEVVNWKDVPQDAEHILEWYRRFRDWYPREVRESKSITALTDEQILELATKHHVHYLVLERGTMDRPLGDSFQQIYPHGIEENAAFAVYEILTSRASRTDTRGGNND